jgi:hypothetical protein
MQTIQWIGVLILEAGAFSSVLLWVTRPKDHA